MALIHMWFSCNNAVTHASSWASVQDGFQIRGIGASGKRWWDLSRDGFIEPEVKYARAWNATRRLASLTYYACYRP